METYNIGESRFEREYYLNRYYGHTLFLRSTKKKSTCRSRELLEKNKEDHTFQILEIITGYYFRKSDIKDEIRLSEERFFISYRKNGCVLVNIKDSGAAVLKKKKKEVIRADCGICGQRDVNQEKSAFKSHCNSKKHKLAIIALEKEKLCKLIDELEESEDEEEVVDLDD